MAETLKVELSPRGIATILLNRPERSNAFDQLMLDELAREFFVRGSDDDTRIIVLRGLGKHFCAGADLSARGNGNSDESAAHASLADVLTALDRFSKPTIAAVHGAAVGGGAAVVACCDIAIATEAAFFSVPEVRAGMAPLGVAPFLARALGERSFLRYGLTGERFSAADALRLGLVHEVVEADKLDDRLATITDALLHGAPGAQRDFKSEMRNAAAPLVIKRSNADVHASAEALEGIASFREKRKPNWYPQ
jgi:methylglutaconyl-CoA hydratase